MSSSNVSSNAFSNAFDVAEKEWKKDQAAKSAPKAPKPSLGMRVATGAASTGLGFDPSATAAATSRFKQPGAMNKAAGAVEWLASGVPYAGAPLVHAMEESSAHKWGPAAAHTGEALINSLMLPYMSERALTETMGKGAVAAKGPSVLDVTLNPSVRRRVMEDYVHAGGLQVQAMTRDALKDVRGRISNLAQNVATKVNEHFPDGAINLTDIANQAQSAWNTVFKIAEKQPAAVRQLLETVEAEDTDPILSKASVFRGSHSGSNTVDVKEFMRTANPQIRERLSRALATELEGPEGGVSTLTAPAMEHRVTFEQLAQSRSRVGQALGQLRDAPFNPSMRRDMRAALNHIYGVMSDEMKRVADEAGVRTDFDAYSAAEKHLDQVILPGTARGVFEANNGEDVGKALLKNGSMRREMVNYFQKYGLNQKAVNQFVTDAENLTKGGWKNLARNWPAFLAGYIGGRTAGIPMPYLVGLGADLGVSHARRILSAVHVRNLPPNLQRILDERAGPPELPPVEP